jgi:tetratricopeptide (TPR) repeat protein
LATQLGYYDDAMRLFKEANRYDLINELLQASGKYERAVRVAENVDRMHMDSTHHQYAQYFESVHDIESAIEQYELAKNANVEVPRMLFNLGKIDRLEKYIAQNDDKELTKWWASYLENGNKVDKAYKYYKKAGDYLSCVRIACFKVCISISNLSFSSCCHCSHKCGGQITANFLISPRSINSLRINNASIVFPIPTSSATIKRTVSCFNAITNGTN